MSVKVGHDSSHAKDGLGRLKALGVREPWQVAFLLPHSWDDLTSVVRDFSELGQSQRDVVVAGRLQGAPKVKWEELPRLIGYLVDAKGRRIGFSAFGDTRELQEQLRQAGDSEVVLYGGLRMLGALPWLTGVEWVPGRWLGWMRPRYPGKTRSISPETVRTRVLELLREAVPVSARWLEEHLAGAGGEAELLRVAGWEGPSLQHLIVCAHTCRSEVMGRRAQAGLERLAALSKLLEARSRLHALVDRGATALGAWRDRVAGLPFDRLTSDQERAVEEVLVDLGRGRPMRRILTGDVGTGKSAVFGLVCAAVADGGGRCVVLAPNEPLAEQTARDFMAWWPDLRVQLVTAATGAIVPDLAIAVGTTALLHRDLGFCPDLVVCDEQQKFSREQREQLCAGNAHLLEVTATCIPRSQALLRYGVVDCSRLWQSHAEKTIHTRLWMPGDGGSVDAELALPMGVVRGIVDTVEDGGQVLVVYPLRGDGKRKAGSEEEGGAMVLRSVERAFARWSERFPGRVRHIHGAAAEEQKSLTMQQMREGMADILVATTVVEVGINLPRLSRVVVVHPERFGLTTLHQIRGRLARHGGVGYCDLYLPDEVGEESVERLRVLEFTQDGFEVAERDLDLRGCGDLRDGADKQWGATDESFLPGRPVGPKTLDQVIEALEARRPSLASALPGS